MCKLFIVTKTESGYRWSKNVFIKYILAPDLETVTNIIKERYGKLNCYYYDDEETHIIIEEVEFEDLTRGKL